jgi:putative colanic acid biosynthesis acetyltransferase WcaF
MSAAMTPTMQLARFDNSGYEPGRSRATQIAWFAIGLPLLRSSWIPFSGFRCELLRWFGARIGVGVVCKPGVRVKYPWRLEVGDHSWIGEDCWIDNLANVAIGRDCCLSQGSYLCTGNHDWADQAFSLIVGEIHVEDGAWVGARATLLPGVTLRAGAIAAAGSVIAHSIPTNEIHGGNPARFIKKRVLRQVAAEAATAATGAATAASAHEPHEDRHEVTV